MFCAKCGNEIREGESVCPECGALTGAPAQSGADAGTAHKSKKIILISVIAAAVVLLAIAAVCYLNSDPYLYASAVSCFEEKDYDRAEKLFSRLGDYEDSGFLLADCQYRHALECVESGEHDRALELIRACETSSYKTETAENDIPMCKERIADAYRDSERYEEAAGLYQELGKVWETAEAYAAMGDYIRAIELTEYDECDREQKEIRGLWHRNQAVLCAAEENYEEAWKYLKKYNGDYDEELCQCAYQTAVFFLNKGKYKEAETIARLLKNDMAEAKQLLNEIYEAWGIACAGEENYKAAWECFRKCEVTEASYPSLYAAAQYYMNQESYLKARDVWDVLGDYQDSALQRAECSRRQGEKLEQAGKYESAIKMYEECGDEGLVNRCKYNWAASAYAQGDYELAMKKYSELGDYEDSVQMITRCRYDLGKVAYSRGNYDLALRIFTELGDYENSVEMAAKVQESAQKKILEDEKKARRGVLEGTWKTEDGDIRIEVSIPHENVFGGGGMNFYMPARTSSVTTMGGTLYGTTMNCRLSDSTFEGADQQVMNYGDIVFRGYNWDSWDYEDGILYLRSRGGGFSTFSCTLSGNTMTLVMEERTFKLTRQ